ncbi:biopolymer transporter ExbD [Alcanivorax sp. JB21]|uniref:ExbD/TolR family protein n=1 Tax=Alcanivorax limicola TaxID=2874102 RepID=UPI001CC1A698|nr:biopolymer transporter ExbD [Alcanivorax limicola]MBZ2187514.1 biopolymer transporter ExbD [Alcanivorax limicola]
MRFRRRERDTEVELNITAFLNLMVVLIPFLLLNAVFAQVAILQLNLPSDDAAPSESENQRAIVLEVMIYQDRYEVIDRQSGPLKILPNTENGEHDRSGLHEYLLEVKGRFPDVNDITLLCEDDTPYELLIQTMDTVRLREVELNGQRIRRELFPDIGIGSAPPDTQRADSAGGTS